MVKSTKEWAILWSLNSHWLSTALTSLRAFCSRDWQNAFEPSHITNTVLPLCHLSNHLNIFQPPWKRRQYIPPKQENTKPLNGAQIQMKTPKNLYSTPQILICNNSQITGSRHRHYEFCCHLVCDTVQSALPPHSSLPWLRQLVTGLSQWRSMFNPGPVHVRFLMDQVALGQDFLPVLQFSPVSIILPMIHAHNSSSTIDNI